MKRIIFLLSVLLYISSLSYGQQLSDELRVLSLPRQEFMDLYNNGGDKKIVLQFMFIDTLNRFTLVAWGSEEHSYNDDNPDKTLEILGSANSIHARESRQQTIFGDQQIKRNLIRSIHDSLEHNTTYNAVVFEPKINYLRHIIYVIRVTEVGPNKSYAATRILGKTDPSPPGHSN